MILETLPFLGFFLMTHFIFFFLFLVFRDKGCGLFGFNLLVQSKNGIFLILFQGVYLSLKLAEVEREGSREEIHKA